MERYLFNNFTVAKCENCNAVKLRESMAVSSKNWNSAQLENILCSCNLNTDEVSVCCSNIRPQGRTASLVMLVFLSPPALNENIASLRRQIEMYWGLNHYSACLRWASFTVFCVAVLQVCRRKIAKITLQVQTINILLQFLTCNLLTTSFQCSE